MEFSYKNTFCWDGIWGLCNLYSGVLPYLCSNYAHMMCPAEDSRRAYETNILIFLKPEKLPCSGFRIQALRRAERGKSEAVTHLTASHSGSSPLHELFLLPWKKNRSSRQKWLDTVHLRTVQWCSFPLPGPAQGEARCWGQRGLSNLKCIRRHLLEPEGALETPCTRWLSRKVNQKWDYLSQQFLENITPSIFPPFNNTKVVYTHCKDSNHGPEHRRLP